MVQIALDELDETPYWRQKHYDFSFTVPRFEIAVLVPRIFGLCTLFQAYRRLIEGLSSRRPQSNLYKLLLCFYQRYK
jgi:hypothetical protein